MNVTRSIYLGIPVIALLAGCGGAATSASDRTPAGTKGGADAGTTAKAPVNCSSVPLSTVESVLGVSGLTASKKIAGGTMTGCLYADASTGKTVSLQTLSGTSAAKMAVEQTIMSKSEKVSPCPGVGDQAFVGTLSAGPTAINTLVARKGTIQVMIESSASSVAEKNLAEKVFSEAG